VRRLQSFSGVLPLGTYLIYHLWKNWAIVRDREQWVDRVIWVSEHFGHTLEILFYIFLTVHVFLAILGKADSDHPLLVSRGQRRTQQVSGAAYATLWSSLPEPVCLAVYLFGMSVLYFHFANGLSRAVVSWGLISTERALRVARYAVSVVGIVLWGLTLQVVGHFVTGQGFFG
jgi:succinate dehydrogenase/fumarate reductase cytochrome b subunit